MVYIETVEDNNERKRAFDKELLYWLTHRAETVRPYSHGYLVCLKDTTKTPSAAEQALLKNATVLAGQHDATIFGLAGPNDVLEMTLVELVAGQ